MAFEPAVSDKKPLQVVDYYKRLFEETVLSNLKIENIRRVITVGVPENIQILPVSEKGKSATYPYSEGTKVEKEEKAVYAEVYADYREFNCSCLSTCVDETIEGKVKDLANGCATLYNALVQNALHKGHKVVLDLFTKNLKFNLVFNDQPSVADPLALIGGWCSFRLLWASDNGFINLINLPQETLSRIEARKK